MTTTTEPLVPTTPAGFLWLDLTRICQLACSHCYNASGATGTHGTMTREDWISVLDQAAAAGVRRVQLIGGEPTLHPHAAELVEHALALGLHVEVFSNMTHVSGRWWELFQRDGVTLATSYYSDQAEQHNAITGRPSHARTRANIAEAVERGSPLRVGIITGDDDQAADAARRDLQTLGVTRIGTDRVRAFGRGAQGREPDPGNLCGRCGTGRAAVGPNGEVSPCVMSGWMSVGNVQTSPLVDIVRGTAMAEATATIRNATGGGGSDDNDCQPDTIPPPAPCEPDNYCGPGPLSGCNPRR